MIQESELEQAREASLRDADPPGSGRVIRTPVAKAGGAGPSGIVKSAKKSSGKSGKKSSGKSSGKSGKASSGKSEAFAHSISPAGHLMRLTRRVQAQLEG